MATAIRMYVEGVPELQIKFKRIERNVRAKISRRVQRAGRNILRDGQNQAPPPRTVTRFTPPAFTGVLKGSFRMNPFNKNMGVEVGSYGARNKRGRGYARFVALGTGSRGAQQRNSLLFVPPGYRHGAKPGMFPQPFIYNDWVLEGNKFLRDCAKILNEEIKGARG